MDANLETELLGPRDDPFAGRSRYQRVKSALTLIGISRSKLYGLVRAGKVRAIKIDKLTYIDLASVGELFKKAPQIAPERHNTMTAEQLGLAEPELLIEEVSTARPLTELSISAQDMAGIMGGK